MKAKSANRYPPELRERAVRMLPEHRGEYDSEPDAIRAISSKPGCHYDTLRAWLRQHKTDVHGDVAPALADGGLTVDERQRLKELERENRELRRSNDILRQASAYFVQAELDRHWKK
ncbi:transposase [Enterobacterales bacterium BIT-L3]|jgi:transposase|uniref:Transposase n=1 Tax=Tenebrionibacter intestinalis TaxID=2799638 RepID=A0A8K0XYS6_9ENTR|nr:transposase [Tenebrionibacter intestinalis]